MAPVIKDVNMCNIELPFLWLYIKLQSKMLMLCEIDLCWTWNYQNSFFSSFLSLIISVLRSIEAKGSVLKGILKTKEFWTLSVII